MTVSRERLALLALLVVAGCPREQTESNSAVSERERFREELVAGFRRHAPDASIELGPTTDQLTVNGRALFLENMFLASQSSPEAREATILGAVDSAMLESVEAAIPAAFDRARGQLRPRVRDLASRSIGALQLALRVDAGMAAFVERPLAEHLLEVLVLDRGSSVIDVPRRSAEQWNRSDDELFFIARQNLSELTSPFEVADGLLRSRQGDTYDAARLVLLDQEVLRTTLRGRPVAFVPNRNTLLVAGEDDPDALLRACDEATEVEGGYPISLQPVISTDGGWQRWKPSSVALAKRVEGLRRLELEETYAEQKQLLEELHTRTEVDVFVASLLEKNGRTFVTWTEGVETWLAEADDVVFVSGPESKPVVRMAPFAKVQQVVGPLMGRVPALEPARWAVTSFPTQQQLRAMKATLLKKEK